MKRELFPLKLLSAFGMLMVIFPLIFTGTVIVYEQISIEQIAFVYGLCLGGALIGYTVAGIRHGHKWKSKAAQTAFSVFTRLLGIAAAVIPFAVMCLLNQKTVMSFIVAVSCVFGYFTGYKFFCKSFSDIFTMPWLGGYAVEFIACFLIYTMYSPEELAEAGKSVMIYSMLIEVLIAAILINQTNISVHTNRRKGTNALIPKGLRAYNMGMIALVAVLFGAFYTFRNQIGYVLYQLYRLIMWLVFRFMSIFSAEPVDLSFNVDEIAGEASQIREGNDLVTFILKIVFIAGCAAAVIIFRKKLLAVLKSFADIFRRKDNLTDNKDSAFTDYYEKIVYEKKNKREKNTLKAAIRAYKREQNPEKKYRLGYRSFMLWMKMNHIPPSRSDTANTHFDKSKGAFADSDTLSEIVNLYNSIRYNSSDVTAENLAEMDKLIELIK